MEHDATMVVLIDWLDEFAAGAFVIVQVFCAALAMAVLWGVLGATAKLSGNRVAACLAEVYTTVLRGTPELLVLLLVYFGSAITLTALVQLVDPSVQYVDIPPFWAGAFAISVMIGAYATETFRGAFLGVDRGQGEAAHSLGLSRRQSFFYVRLPQMWRLALPAFGNNMVSLMKDTALISVVGLEEIVFTAKMATSVTQQPFTMYAMVAGIYLLFTSALMGIVWALERHASRHLTRGR